MRVFIDTNLWVCRLDRRDPDKALRVLDAHVLAQRRHLHDQPAGGLRGWPGHPRICLGDPAGGSDH